MITVGICDDERLQRVTLRNIIEPYFQLKGQDYKIEEFENGENLILKLLQDSYSLNLIFLDIQMEGMDGVETARRIRKLSKDAVLVFVTGYEDYVFRGYEVGALNYVVKPYTGEKMVRILDAAIEKLDISKEQSLPVRQGTSLIKVPVKDIRYLSSRLRKISVVTENGMFEFYGKLGEVIQHLPGCFVRIHQSYVVNLNYIDKVDTTQVYIGNEKLPVSRKYYQKVSGEFARFLLKQ